MATLSSLRLPLLLLLLGLLLLLAPTVRGHGMMTKPATRGALKPDRVTGLSPYDPGAPTDYCAHCQNGGGKAAVFAASGGNWKPYTPLKPGFRFTAGLCGDKKGASPEPHRKGGQFFYGGKTVASYRPGQVIDIEMAINAHHNGYVSLYLCNLDACGADDIEEKCFRNGHCAKLRRVPVPSCESGRDMGCGPIDPARPGRFYLPCRDTSRGIWQMFGPGRKILYKLPAGVRCRHCVLQWYWATANSCNPAGTKAYFSGPRRPRAWLDSRCPGDGGSVGGVAMHSADCGGSRSPEEFWGCADVAISGAAAPSDPDDNSSSNNPTPPVPTRPPASPSPAPRVVNPRAVAPPPPPPPPPAGSCSPRWQQCAGRGFRRKRCCPGLVCHYLNDYYSQCDVPRGPRPQQNQQPDDSPEDSITPKMQQGTVPRYEQCGGDGYTGPTKCTGTDKCVSFGSCYSQCRPS